MAEPAPSGVGNGNNGGGDDNADLSSSCLRVCHYRRRPEDNAPSIKPDDDDPQIEVLFDSHTDSSLLTLSTLCPGAPGLQLQVGGEWLSIESVDGVSEVDVESTSATNCAFYRATTSRRASIGSCARCLARAVYPFPSSSARDRITCWTQPSTIRKVPIRTSLK